MVSNKSLLMLYFPVLFYEKSFIFYIVTAEKRGRFFLGLKDNKENRENFVSTCVKHAHYKFEPCLPLEYFPFYGKQYQEDNKSLTTNS